MQLIVCDDAEAAARECAVRIADAARAAVAGRGRAAIAFSGGRTPVAMLRRLAERDVDWMRIHVCQTDERLVQARHPDRNWTQLEEALLSHVTVPADHQHPMPVESLDPAAAALQYAAELERVAGTPPALDIVHLGLGADGHTASLVDDDVALEAAGDVALTRRFGGYRRMTLTLAAINRARATVWLVTGADKVEAVRRLRAADRSIPAGRVDQSRATLIVDRPANG